MARMTSSSNLYDNIDTTKIKDIQLHIENNSTTLDDIVDSIVKPYVESLDRYVTFISKCLADGENPPTTAELDDYVLNLSTYIYFASGACERLGIKDDVSKAVYKEMYHSTRNETNTGTVADKDSLAELASQQEFLANVCYSRAYKIVKAKVASAQELLSGVKKVLSHRLTEMELTRLQP